MREDAGRLQPVATDLVPRAAELLNDAVGGVGDARAQRADQLARADAWALVVGDAVVGAVSGTPAQGAWVITAIGVDPARRREGWGRRMVELLTVTIDADSIVAETDADAIGFYRRCGFGVVSLGEAYPGVERFACRRRLR